MFSLSRKIADYIESENGECEVNIAPFAVFLNEDDINYVEPDISIVCDSSKLDDKGCHGAPVWIIEVVSPGNKPMDYFTKLFKYRSAGVSRMICIFSYFTYQYTESNTTLQATGYQA